MKRAATFIVAMLIVAACVHVATVWALPSVIMSKVVDRIGGHAEVNHFIEPPLATDKARTVVRPSPDLAYSVCVLDLSRGPVRIHVPLTPPYTSIALYSGTTDNYFVRNDRDTGGKPLDVIVVAPGAKMPGGVPEGTNVVTAPTVKGLALVRRAVEDAASFPALDRIRKTATCAPM